jgi:hypothetical protein
MFVGVGAAAGHDVRMRRLLGMLAPCASLLACSAVGDRLGPSGASETGAGGQLALGVGGTSATAGQGPAGHGGSAGALAPAGPLIEIASGNGQVTLEFFATVEPLVVRVTDAGEPATDLPVSFEVIDGQGGLGDPETTTDAAGLAATSFVGTLIPAGLSFAQQTVRASIESGCVDFVVTTAYLGNSYPVYPGTHLLEPDGAERDLGTGQAGAVLPAAVQVLVVTEWGPDIGVPVPNVSLRLINGSDADQPPAASCVGDTVMTDASGIGSCDVALSNELGPARLTAVVGSYRLFEGIELVIEP